MRSPLPKGLCLCFLALVLSSTLHAQSTTWDSLLSNSQWYVPAENLLAYLTTTSDLTDVTPAADQTIWQLGTATNGVFTGTSVATMQAGAFTFSSTSSMNGIVMDSGQVRIAFSAPDAPTTIGIGQIRDISGTSYLEMQMMTGTAFYVTHWAYMAAYGGNPDTLPPLVLEPEFLSPEWAWMDGTSWALECEKLFGAGQQGQFLIDDYVNGYFWGTGTGPDGSAAETFTLIGSATPEGNILFNVLSDGVLTGLAGQIAGDATNGSMVLRSYESLDNFTTGAAQVVPEPHGIAVLGLLFASSALWRRRRTGK
jgi:hypothetical protein